MQRELISGSKRALGAAAIVLLLASAIGSAYAAGSYGDTPAAAAATASLNAGQVNNAPSYRVSYPAPGIVAVTPSPPRSPSAPPPRPPNLTAPYPPSVPAAQLSTPR